MRLRNKGALARRRSEMAERSFKEEVRLLRLGAGDEFRG